MMIHCLQGGVQVSSSFAIWIWGVNYLVFVQEKCVYLLKIIDQVVQNKDVLTKSFRMKTFAMCQEFVAVHLKLCKSIIQQIPACSCVYVRAFERTCTLRLNKEY